MSYKKVLLGTNPFSPLWLPALNEINESHIFISDFNKESILDLIDEQHIDYIIPLSERDNKLIKKYKQNNKIKDNVQVLYPNDDVFELLDNKCRFNEFMLVHFRELIPDIYFLNGEKIKDIEYPVIFKTAYSTNGLNMKIYTNETEFLQCNDKTIIQKFVDYNDEYAAFILCINGEIINWKVIKHKYRKFHIKTNNFPKNYIDDKTFDIQVFEKLIKYLNYSGGMCINFKFNVMTNSAYIFEINPRFGGSAFSNNFISELISIKHK